MKITAVFSGLVLTAIVTLAGAENSVLEVGKFGAANEGNTLASGWRPLEFKKIERHTSYALVRDGERVVVQAKSEASASGLVRPMRIDPKEWPIVTWSWKIANLVDKADVTKKSGDDYPARIYITFEYDPARVGFFERAKFEAVKLLYGEYPPIAAINYVWDGRAPAGEIVSNAYTDRVKMIVVESGGADVGRWKEERRDVLADYKKAFGADPPVISGVAIMTDTDNTGESAVAWYGDIAFAKR